jgi:hypothetical protein
MDVSCVFFVFGGVGSNYSGKIAKPLGGLGQEGLFDRRSYPYQAAIGHFQRMCRGKRQIDDAAFGEWPAVVDHHGDAAVRPLVGHVQVRPKRQSAVRGG